MKNPVMSNKTFEKYSAIGGFIAKTNSYAFVSNEKYFF